MVLWEITLATAYFLGLRRSYKLAVNLQRRIIPPQYPKIRKFAQGRTRAIFDVAVKVHRSIQERDLEFGRNLGNWILRSLDKMNPTANIRGGPEMKLLGLNKIQSSTTKITTNNNLQKTRGFLQRFRARNTEQASSRRYLFSNARSTWRRSFPSIAMMIRPPCPAGNTTQYRQLFVNQNGPMAVKACGGGMFEGGIRKDIRLWMQCS